MIELLRVSKLCPRSRTPDLLPACIRVGASTISAVYKARTGSVQYVCLSVVRVLQRRIVAGDSVSGIQADKVGEVTMGVIRVIFFDFPFFTQKSVDEFRRWEKNRKHLAIAPKNQCGCPCPSLRASSEPPSRTRYLYRQRLSSPSQRRLKAAISWSEHGRNL